MYAMRLVMFAAVFGVALAPSDVSARRIEQWPYDRLLKEADLVVIAEAISTEDTKDKPEEKGWDNLSGLNTTLKVKETIKGKAGGEQIKVLYFKCTPGKEEENARNGPSYLTFRTEITDVKFENGRVSLPKPDYLLFLKARKDGRFEPLSGIDASLSVREMYDPRRVVIDK